MGVSESVEAESTCEVPDFEVVVVSSFAFLIVIRCIYCRLRLLNFQNNPSILAPTEEEQDTVDISHKKMAEALQQGTWPRDVAAHPETHQITVRLRHSCAVEALTGKLKRGGGGKNWPADVTVGLLRDILLKVSQVCGILKFMQ